MGHGHAVPRAPRQRHMTGSTWTRSSTRPRLLRTRRSWSRSSTRWTREGQMAELQEITSGLEFPEGPIAMKRRQRARLRDRRRADHARRARTARRTWWPSAEAARTARAIGPDGKLYVSNNGGSFRYMDMGGLDFPHQPPPESWNGGRIERIDIETGEVDVLYEECDGLPLRGPERHRLRCARRVLVHRPRRQARAGRATAPASTTRSRRLGIREAIFPMDAPNGIGLSPDGSRLYVAETFANTCWWWKVTGPRRGRGGARRVPARRHAARTRRRPPGLRLARRGRRWARRASRRS